MKNLYDLIISEEVPNTDFENFLRAQKLYISMRDLLKFLKKNSNLSYDNIMFFLEKMNLCPSITDLVVKAIRADDEKVLDYLLGKGIDVNLSDSTHNSSPIMFAAQNARISMVKSLLSRGATVTDDCKYNKSALYFALISNESAVIYDNNRIECIKILIRAGSNIEFGRICDNKGIYHIAKSLKQDVENEVKAETDKTGKLNTALTEKLATILEESDVKAEIESNAKAVIESEVKAEIESESKAESDAKAESNPKAEIESDAKTESNPKAEIESDVKTESNPKAEIESDVKDDKATITLDANAEIKSDANEENKPTINLDVMEKLDFIADTSTTYTSVKEKKINDCVELVTTDGDIIKIPSLPNPKIKMLCKNNIPSYKLCILSTPVSVLICIENKWEKCTLSGQNYDIEIPPCDKINYHYLPAGVVLDDATTTEAYLCKFENIVVDQGDMVIMMNNIYI